ncbi:MAG: Eco57I restriction-modification methylase domain-containing protein [Candidatus Thorarchaeota archaeon]
MSNDIYQLALEILLDTRYRLEKFLSSELTSSIVTEATRLISLNRAFAYWRKADFCGSELPFVELSLTGMKASVNHDTLLEVACDFWDSDQSTYPQCSDQLDLFKIVDVLGIIHTIGAHSLPPTGFSEKRILGAFYTPSELAYFITKKTMTPYLLGKDVEDFKNMTILDPCCGPGVFLISAFSVMNNWLNSKFGQSQHTDEISTTLAKNFFGVDLDPASLEIASVCLSAAADDNSYRSFKSQFRAGNALISLQGLRASDNHEKFFTNSENRMPFEWGTQFSKPLKDGGFDIVLFNPPYNRLRPNLAEYIRTNLRSGVSDIRMSDYEDYKRELHEDLDYIRNSGEFSASLSNAINTYHLFIERSLALTKEGGHIGFIVPSTLLADYSSRNLRQELFYHNMVRSFTEFPESARLFSGVTQSICIGHVEKGGLTNEFEVQIGMQSLNEVPNNKPYTVRVADISNSFGSSLIIPRISQSDWILVKRMHRHPFLATYSWLKNHRGELDLTIDKEYIHEGQGRYPLVRGSAIGRYALRDSSGKCSSECVDIEGFRLSKKNSERMGHIELKRIACQQISNQANHWRLKFSRIPEGTVLANSCNYLVLRKEIDESVLDFLLAVMNSELMNWRFSISSSNNHVSNHELSLLPLIDSLSDDVKASSRYVTQLMRNIRSDTNDVVPSVEGSIFSIYGFTRKNARRVLESRGKDRSIIEEILSHI